MHRDIWVFIEQTEGTIANGSLELIGKAVGLRNKMAHPGQIIGVLMGYEVKGLTEMVAQYGVEKIYVADEPRLELYHPEYYSKILVDLIEKEDPHILLVGATYLGSHLAPMVAAKVKTGMAAHAIELKIDENDHLIAVVPAFGGKVLGDILCPSHRPQMASIKPGILDKPEKILGDTEVILVDLSFMDDFEPKLKPLGVHRQKLEGVPLEEADIVVCGGFGIGDKKNWEMLEILARKVGGAVACTRPPVDEGWSEGEHIMVGTSGRSIRPKIYLGFGISGATHHVCGMKDAGLIISINRDEKAEVFRVSDYGIVGDIGEILPLLVENI